LYDCEFDDRDDTCESIEGFRGAVGRVSGRWLGREGGGMVTGEDGGEMPADERTGAETLRSWAYEESFGAGLLAVKGGDGGSRWCVVVRVGVLEASSSASRASSFSLGERGPSWWEVAEWGGERGVRTALSLLLWAVKLRLDCWSGLGMGFLRFRAVGSIGEGGWCRGDSDSRSGREPSVDGAAARGVGVENALLLLLLSIDGPPR
jgi:hypothetical protein